MEKSHAQIAEDWFIFINEEFYKFRGNSRKTISDFAKWFDLPQGQLSQYMKKGGKIPRNQTVISKFVNRLGQKVYIILGYPVPSDSIDSLPEPTRSIAREFREILAENKIIGDSPEASELLDEIMKKHGYSKIETNSPAGDK